MNEANWPELFRRIYEAGVKRYSEGNQSARGFFKQHEVGFLASIGCSGQELFDFIEDGCRGGEPTFETALLITAVRRDYFLLEQGGTAMGRVVDMDGLPSKQATVEGIAWLPRLIVKARAKLRGEMPPELMYGCGGDRPFAKSMKFHLADFLRVVWAAGGDDARIVAWVKKMAGRA